MSGSSKLCREPIDMMFHLEFKYYFNHTKTYTILVNINLSF